MLGVKDVSLYYGKSNLSVRVAFLTSPCGRDERTGLFRLWVEENSDAPKLCQELSWGAGAPQNTTGRADPWGLILSAWHLQGSLGPLGKFRTSSITSAGPTKELSWGLDPSHAPIMMPGGSTHFISTFSWAFSLRPETNR